MKHGISVMVFLIIFFTGLYWIDTQIERLVKTKKLNTQVEVQSELLKTQQENIHYMESMIELSDPDYILIWRRPCVDNWDWPMWAKEIKEGKPPLRCWSGCDW